MPPSDRPLSDATFLEDVERMLRTDRFGRKLRGYATVTSTNALAAAWAAEGAPEGSVVYADHQTAGRGRQGRRWEAEHGLNLTFSLVLRPTLSPECMGLITLAAGLATSEVVDRYAEPYRTSIKWPNDVLLRDRKCCGILLESVFQQNTMRGVLGIGLNVNQQTFPPHLEDTATSILHETGRILPRRPLFADLLRRLEARYNEVAADGGASVRAAYLERMVGLGKPATLRFVGGGEEIRGTIAGIAATGGLLLDTPAGRRSFHAGEVTTAR